jgi:hypothetical protein
MTVSRRVSAFKFGLITHTNQGLISSSYSNICQSSLHNSLYLVSSLRRDATITVWRHNARGSRLLCSCLCFVPFAVTYTRFFGESTGVPIELFAESSRPDLPPAHWRSMSSYQSYFTGSIIYMCCDYYLTCGEIEMSSPSTSPVAPDRPSRSPIRRQNTHRHILTSERRVRICV